MKRQMEKEIAELTETLDDVREFLKRLNFIIEERKYVPHIDDGVLLNMAPLWELIPSWQAGAEEGMGGFGEGRLDLGSSGYGSPSQSGKTKSARRTSPTPSPMGWRKQLR